MSKTKDNLYKYYDIVYGQWMGIGKTNSEINLIKQLLSSKNSPHILDIGCGSGRTCIPLHQQGYTIEGLELSGEQIKALHNKEPKIKVIKANILKKSLPKEKFDLIYLLWNAFGEIVLDEDKAAKLFSNLHQALKPNGLILFDHSDIRKRDIPDGLNRNQHIRHNGLDYYLSWHVDHFDPTTRTTTCLTLIEVEKEGQIIDRAQSFITQRWWEQEEVKNLIDPQMFHTQIKTIPQSDYLYFVLKKYKKGNHVQTHS